LEDDEETMVNIAKNESKELKKAKMKNKDENPIEINEIKGGRTNEAKRDQNSLEFSAITCMRGGRNLLEKMF
jgi:hypothetical protein